MTLRDMLKRIFQRRPRPPEPTIAVAMVALPSATLPEPDIVVAALRGMQPGLQIAGAERKDAIVALDIPDVMSVYALMPGPIPRTDLEWATRAAAPLWPDAEQSLRAHVAHLIVHVGSQTFSPVDTWLLLTHLVAAIVRSGECIGVYWGAASLVHEPTRFVREATSATREDLPLELWIGLHPIKTENGISLFTTGLEAFGAMDFEVRESRRDLEAVLSLVAGLAHYVITSRAVIKDGDSVGGSDSERFRVVHTTSAFIPGRRVCLIAW